MLFHIVQTLYIRWTGVSLVQKKSCTGWNHKLSVLPPRLPTTSLQFFFSFFFHGTVLVVSNWVSQSHLPPPALLHEQIVMKFCGQIGIGPQNEMNKEPGSGPALKLASSRKRTLYCCVREEERANVRRIQLLARGLPRIFFLFSDRAVFCPWFLLKHLDFVV